MRRSVEKGRRLGRRFGSNTARLRQMKGLGSCTLSLGGNIFHKTGFRKLKRSCIEPRLCILRSFMGTQKGWPHIWIHNTWVCKRQLTLEWATRSAGSVEASSSAGDISGKSLVRRRAFLHIGSIFWVQNTCIWDQYNRVCESISRSSIDLELDLWISRALET